MLFKFGKVTSPLCSFCKLEDETPLHLFYFCSKTQILWNPLQQLFLHNLTIPERTPQSAIFGFIDIQDKTYKIINHLLLIYKFYVYKARDSGNLNIHKLKINIRKIKNIEKEICKDDPKKKLKFVKKWQEIIDILN